jgi:hypothetical protein
MAWAKAQDPERREKIVAVRDHGVLFCPPFVAQRYNEFVRDSFRLERLPYPNGMKPVRMKIYLVKHNSSLEGEDVNILARAIRRRCE